MSTGKTNAALLNLPSSSTPSESTLLESTMTVPNTVWKYFILYLGHLQKEEWAKPI